MEIWYYDNDDLSGLFSTKEKALAAFKKDAAECEWANEVIEDHGNWVKLDYDCYSDGDNDAVYKNTAYITSHIVDDEDR